MDPPTCETCGREVDETKAIYKSVWDIYLCDEECEREWMEKQE